MNMERNASANRVDLCIHFVSSNQQVKSPGELVQVKNRKRPAEIRLTIHRVITRIGDVSYKYTVTCKHSIHFITIEVLGRISFSCYYSKLETSEGYPRLFVVLGC